MRKTLLLLSLSLLCFAVVSAQSITVTTPHAGLTWNLGATYTIQWTPAGIAPGARADIYLFQGGVWVKDIARGIDANSGSFPWRVPNDTRTGASQVKVVLLGSSPEVSGLSDTFTIDTIKARVFNPPVSLPPKIKVDYPNGGEVISTPALRIYYSYYPGCDTSSRMAHIYVDRYGMEVLPPLTGRMIRIASYEISYTHLQSEGIMIDVARYPTGLGIYKIRVESTSPSLIRDESDGFFSIVH